MKQAKNFSPQKKQGGFTLLELAIVIAMVAGLIIILVKSGSSVGSSRKASSEVTAVSAIMENAKAFKSGGSYGAGTDMVPILIRANQVPGAIGVTANTLANQWNGTITIVGTGPQLTLTDNGVPADACASVLTGVGNGDSSMVTSVGGAVVPMANGIITTQAAADACAGAGPVAISFVSAN